MNYVTAVIGPRVDKTMGLYIEYSETETLLHTLKGFVEKWVLMSSAIAVPAPPDLRCSPPISQQ